MIKSHKFNLIFLLYLKGWQYSHPHLLSPFGFRNRMIQREIHNLLLTKKIEIIFQS